MQTTVTVFLLVCLLGTIAFAATPVVKVGEGSVRIVPVRGRDKVGEMGVVLPRTWMKATDVLVAAGYQAGLIYVIIPARLDAPVGPFVPGESVKVEDLMRRVAEACGARAKWVNQVAVFDPPGPNKPAVDAALAAPAALAALKDEADPSRARKNAESARARISELDAIGDSSTVVELTRLAGHGDGSVRLHALAALVRLEGDFLRGGYPGRVSIFELLSDQVDREGLLYALEEGGPVGGRNWKLAAELLGRGRERVLARHLWEQVWQKADGAMEVGLWALGRCGDPSAAWAMRARVRETFTNDPSHRYLAAMALGQVDGIRELAADRESPQADLRRATAFGLGFCRADSQQAMQYLAALLADADPSVRFVACQSLARRGDKQAVEKLTALAADDKGPPDLRASAMTALVTFGLPGAGETVLARVGDPDATVRAQAAALLADLGGPAARQAQAALVKMLEDGNRQVRCAAVDSLARLGTADGLARAGAVLSNEKSNADERISALLGLGHSLSPQAADPLAAVACDTAVPTRLRQYAVLGLARLANRAGQKRMAELADPNSDKYLSLAMRLLDLGTARETAEFLIPWLTHGRRETACAAAGRLAEIGYGPAVAELLEGSDVFDNHTRMMHMWGASRAGGREVTMALVGASGSREGSREGSEGSRASIRRAAAFALGGRLYPEAVDALIRLARDKESGVRVAAAQSLGVTPDPKALEVLTELAVKDPDTRVAIEAARALRCRDFRHLPAVRATLDQLVGTPRDPGGIDARPASLADQPDNSFALRSWAEAVEEDLVCNLTYESSMCYDAHGQRVVMWGAHGRRYDSPQTGQTWFYNAAANLWERLTTSRHWPNGTCCIRGTMYDDANYAVISPRSGGGNGHGWHNALRANLTHSSPWVLDVRTDQWYAARPLEAEPGGGFMPGSHDPVHGVTLWWKDRLIAFDVYANRWLRFKPQGPTPQFPGDTGGVFDPTTGRFIAVATHSTWAFDPAANAWIDLKPAGPQPPACPMVYDSANDVMLAFQANDNQVAVWVYHIRANRWEQLAEANPYPAYGRIWDAAYDVKNNVTVISGTSPFGYSASLNSRETWTYRYASEHRAAPTLQSPRDIQCVTAADGTVKVSWTPAGPARPARYRIERGAGEQPWLVKWEQAGEVGGDQDGSQGFTDKPGKKALTFYRVTAVGADGKAAEGSREGSHEGSRPSLPGRTAPRIISQVTAVARAAGGVQLRWSAASQSDVVGYNVYRAPAELTPWSKQFAADQVAGALQRITDQPVAAAEWLDSQAKVTSPADELTWPKTFAYVVRAVNAWGLEGGPSPVTVALPDPPGPVQVVPWADGRRLVLWSPCLSGNVVGYHLMRMDDWNSHHVFRLQAAPLAAPAFWDSQDYPTGDRRRYYASGVDELGAVGIPTSGAWSHGYP